MIKYNTLKIVSEVIKIGTNILVIPEKGRKSTSKLGGVYIQDQNILLESFKKSGGNSDNIEQGGLLRAFYNPMSKIIFLSKDIKINNSHQIKFGDNTVNEFLQGRFLHEYAHHIWYYGISGVERQMWNKMYNSVKNDFWRAQISYKASKGASECFAEIYVAFIYNGSFESRLKALKGASDMFINMMK